MCANTCKTSCIICQNLLKRHIIYQDDVRRYVPKVKLYQPEIQTAASFPVRNAGGIYTVIIDYRSCFCKYFIKILKKFEN